MGSLLIKFPTRNRRDRFFEVLDLYRSRLSGKHDVQFLITCDEDDPEMNRPDVRERLDATHNLKYRFGQSKTKIEAVNADMDLAGDWNTLLLASDDMIPVADGYDDIIVSDMERLFPDFSGSLWYDDGRNPYVQTLLIVGKEFYRRLGCLYHPDFVSLYADQWTQDVASHWQKLAKFSRTIIVHGHYRVHGWDTLYQRNQTLEQDRAVYLKLQGDGMPK